MSVVSVRERRGRFETQIQMRRPIRKDHVKSEAGNGVMGLQAKEHQELPTTTRSKRVTWNRFFPRASRRNKP